MAVFLVILGVLIAAFVLLNWFPETTRKWFMLFLKARRILIGIGAGIAVLVLLSSGVLFLQIIAGIAALYVILLIAFDPTMDEVRAFFMTIFSIIKSVIKSIPIVGRVV